MGVYSYSQSMKSFAALVLIVSFVGIGIFGFALLDHAMMHGSNSSCVASTIDRTACPASIIDMTLHHIFAFQRLMTTVLPLTSSMLLLLTSLFSLGLALLSLFLFSPPRLAVSRYRQRYSFFAPQEQQRIHWLELLENSPANI